MVADVLQARVPAQGQVQTPEEEAPDQEVIMVQGVVQTQTQIPALQEEVLLR